MDELEFYSSHSTATDPGRPLSDLPRDPATLARLVGGVMVHRDWTQHFGFTLPAARRDEP